MGVVCLAVLPGAVYVQMIATDRHCAVFLLDAASSMLLYPLFISPKASGCLLSNTVLLSLFVIFRELFNKSSVLG